MLEGDGHPTRKYDGTCLLFESGKWWARREVKPGKNWPDVYLPVQTDEITGKTVGWEPAAQSSFAKYLDEALANPRGPWGFWPEDSPVEGNTYELIGPKVNGNPEKASAHFLVRHGYTSAEDCEELQKLIAQAPEFIGLQVWLHEHSGWEGVVWHHPDGRMAKIKRRDFLG